LTVAVWAMIAYATLADHLRFNMQGGTRREAGLKPFGARQALALRAMPIAAGVEGVTDQAAVGTVLRMSTQCGRPACPDRRQHQEVITAVIGAVIVGGEKRARAALAKG
jgi:hypothetical protein